MKHLFRAALLVASVLLLGCDPVQETPAAKDRRIRIISSHLPAGAANIRDAGNGWYTFDLETSAKVRSFLFMYREMGSASTETITEISR